MMPAESANLRQVGCKQERIDNSQSVSQAKANTHLQARFDMEAILLFEASFVITW